MPETWDRIAKLLPTFRSAVLSARDADGYPLSFRCQPRLDHARRDLVVAAPPGLALTPGPASLLCHFHDEKLWNQRSFLVRGALAREGDLWRLAPLEFIPGLGVDGLPGLLRFVRASSRAANRYLRARRLARPRIPWDEINAAKARAKA
jgi:hypothetical protein